MPPRPGDDEAPIGIVASWGDERGLHADRAYEAGAIVAAVRIATLVPGPDRHSLQLGRARHARIVPEVLQLLNHSCDPNLVLDVDRLTLAALRPIEPGEELTLFYPATEWEMAEPFACACGTARCVGWIAGAAHLSPETLAGYPLAAHIRHNLDERQCRRSG